MAVCLGKFKLSYEISGLKSVLQSMGSLELQGLPQNLEFLNLYLVRSSPDKNPEESVLKSLVKTFLYYWTSVQKFPGTRVWKETLLLGSGRPCESCGLQFYYHKNSYFKKQTFKHKLTTIDALDELLQWWLWKLYEKPLNSIFLFLFQVHPWEKNDSVPWIAAQCFLIPYHCDNISPGKDCSQPLQIVVYCGLMRTRVW